MQVSLRLSLTNFWVGFFTYETHQPIYKEFPAGFNKSTERLVTVEVFREIIINLIPCVSIDLTWKVGEEYEPLHHVDVIGCYTDDSDEFALPYEGEII